MPTPLFIELLLIQRVSLEENMEERILKLYCKLRDIGASFLIYHERDNVEKIKKIMPEIQEFVLWFLEENRLEIEEELYHNISENLLIIMNDILEALEQKDTVLLHDAVLNGLFEYLQLFVVLKQGEKSYDSI